LLVMYMVVNWDMVNSIYRGYRVVFHPNLGALQYFSMYI